MVSCVQAVDEFLKAHPDAAGLPEAAAAMAAASVIDDPRNSATSRSMMVGRFLDAMDTLRALAPEKTEDSPLDQIRAELRRSEAADRVASSRGRPPQG